LTTGRRRATPVIGRLDDQVNDVLIDPVGKKGRRRDGEDDEHAASDGTRRGATVEGPRGAARNANDEESLPRTNREGGRRGDERLPVWLL